MVAPMSPAPGCCAGATWLARVTAACGAAAAGTGSGPLAQQRLFSAYVHVGSNEQGFKGAPNGGHIRGILSMQLCCFCWIPDVQ